MLFLKIISIIALSLWVISNLYVAVTETAEEMREDYVKNQCLIGKVCTNIFYAPAWVLKVLKAIIA